MSGKSAVPRSMAAGFLAVMRRLFTSRGSGRRAWGPRTLGERLRGEGGGSVVEFALVMPMLLTFFFGLMEVCMASYERQVITECAREGTRYASVHGSACVTAAGASCTVTTSAVNSYVSSLAWPNLAGGTMSVSTSYPPLGCEAPGCSVAVVVTYRFPLSIPGIAASRLTMSSTSITAINQ